MPKTIRAIAVACALAGLLPAAAQAQQPAPKPFTVAAEARWNKLYQAVEKLAREGQEVGRITPAEHKAIQDYIAKGRAFIAEKKKDGKFTESEEESVDKGNAGLLAAIANYMSDTQRKAAPATAAKAVTPVAATAAKPWTLAAETRWNKLYAAVEKLAREGEEVRRITPAEHKAISDYIVKARAFIAEKKKDGKFTEAEEESVDKGNAGLLAAVANYMSDTQRKAAAPAKK